MSYYKAKEIEGDFETVINQAEAALKEEGFGVLTEIDVKNTLKQKLDVDFRPYKILGACNPPFAHKALQAEEHIGLMLPCNVVVQEKEPGKITVSAIDPQVSMQGVPNENLAAVAGEVKTKLFRAIDNIGQVNG